jgi:hypothetical protein
MIGERSMPQPTCLTAEVVANFIIRSQVDVVRSPAGDQK